MTARRGWCDNVRGLSFIQVGIPMKQVVCGVLLFALPAFSCLAEATAGRAILRLTTAAAGGKYSPRHVLAVWVTDEKGAFVKTLEVRARKHGKQLREWRKATQDRDDALVDAVTGATLKRHETRDVAWDCRDARGNVVPDGVYRIFVEFTEKQGRGPVTAPDYIVFRKGAEPFRGRARDSRYFRDVALAYDPAAPADRR